jgi:hypothetical protein
VEDCIEMDVEDLIQEDLTNIIIVDMVVGGVEASHANPALKVDPTSNF